MKIHRLISTCCGVGYSTYAPGTIGSLLGFLLALLLNDHFLFVAIIIFFFTGVWASRLTAEETGAEDPQIVVIDEVVGMMVTLLFIPKTLFFYIAGFVLFRLFDITKPLVIRKSETVKGGWGVMLDDVLAGVFANITLQLLHLGYLLVKNLN